MTIKQMRDLSYKKPDNVTWEDFDKMEVTMTGINGIEFISEFSDKTGVVTIMNEEREEKQVFNFVTEEVHEQLISPNEIDEMCDCGCDNDYELVDDESLDVFNAVPELTMWLHERIEFDTN